MNLLAKDILAEGSKNGALSYRSIDHKSQSSIQIQKTKKKSNERNYDHDSLLNSHRSLGSATNPATSLNATSLLNSTKIRKINPSITQQKEWKLPLSPNRYKHYSDKEIIYPNKLKKRK